MTDNRPTAAAARETRIRQAVQAAQHTLPAPLPAAEIAARLIAGRTRLDLSQTQIAAQAGLSLYHVVPELEAGSDRERNPLTLAALAHVLGEEWDYLGAMAPPAIAPGRGRALATARIARGWTLDELAARTGHARSSLSLLEHGKLNGSRRTWRNCCFDWSITFGPQPFWSWALPWASPRPT